MKNFRKFMEEVDPSEEDDDKKSSPELISI